mgnify:CR=1 FL=1
MDQVHRGLGGAVDQEHGRSTGSAQNQQWRELTCQASAAARRGGEKRGKGEETEGVLTEGRRRRNDDGRRPAEPGGMGAAAFRRRAVPTKGQPRSAVT